MVCSRRAPMFSARFVDLRGEFRDFFQRVVRQHQLDAFGFQQRDVLLGQRVLRLFENADEIFHGERLQLHADRETVPAAPESDRSAWRRGTRRPR